MYEIQRLDQYGQWTPDGIGDDNSFESAEAAELMMLDLQREDEAVNGAFRRSTDYPISSPACRKQRGPMRPFSASIRAGESCQQNSSVAGAKGRSHVARAPKIGNEEIKMRRLLNFCRRVLRAVFGRTPAWLEKAVNRAADGFEAIPSVGTFGTGGFACNCGSLS